MSERVILVGHTITTLAMLGVMWAVQLVIYPAFRSVGENDFSRYVNDHSTRIVFVLALFAPLEVIFALSMWVSPPFGVSQTLALAGGLILVAMWVSTGFYFAPFHGRLQSSGADPAMIQTLISTNWLRTLGWTMRGIIAASLLWQALKDVPNPS